MSYSSPPVGWCALRQRVQARPLSQRRCSVLGAFEEFLSLFMKVPERLASPFGVYMFVMLGVLAIALGALQILKDVLTQVLLDCLDGSSAKS